MSELMRHSTSKNFHFCLAIFWKSRDILSKVKWAFCSFQSSVVLTLKLFHGAIFAQFLSCKIMNNDLTWAKCGLQPFRYCSGFKNGFAASWKSYQSNFWMPATPKKVDSCPVCPCRGQWLSLWFKRIPNLLKNILVTIRGLRDDNDLVFNPL